MDSLFCACGLYCMHQPNHAKGNMERGITGMKKTMVRWCCAVLCAAVCFQGAPALAEEAPSSVAAYWALVSGSPVAAQTSERAEFKLLEQVMNGVYSDGSLADTAHAQALASAMPLLAQLPQDEITAFANAYQMDEQAVRHAYYQALANALKAEIHLNPASEERYRNIQILLDLFLSDEDGDDDDAERETIRGLITPQQVKTISEDYGLPSGFVTHIVMDDDWDDDDWDDDDDWRDDDRYDDWDDDWDDDDDDDDDDDRDDDRDDDWDDDDDDDRDDDRDDDWDDDDDDDDDDD